MKFSDFHPMAQKRPKRASISLRIQAIFACGRLERKSAKSWKSCEIWEKSGKYEKCGNLRRSAKSQKFTKKCEKCEKCENGLNFINISLDFIRYFRHWRFWHEKSGNYGFYINFTKNIIFTENIWFY